MTRLHVGGRVIKTALSVTLAIFVAQQLGLERVGLAAIVAVVTVQRTFYRSLRQSLTKLGSVLLGAILGSVFGYIFDLTPLGYGLLTLTAILVCLQLHWQDNIILTTVTAVTVMFSGAENLVVYSLEQVLTALVGALCALAMNYLFTPNHEQEVIQRLLQVEEGLRQLLEFIITEIRQPGCDDSVFKDTVARLKEEIREGMDIAKLLREEHLYIITRETLSDRYRQAFHIMSSQLDRLEEMHILARRMPVKVPQGEYLVKLCRIVQKIQYRQLRGRRTAYALLDRALENQERRIAAMELPRTREEFVSRASLFHLRQELKRYYRRTLQLPAVVD